MLFTPIKPMLLTMKSEAFDDERYIFEPKWDGWRISLHKQGDRIEAYTKNGRNVSAKFPELESVRNSIHSDTAILDCEGVCIRNGRSIFDDFQHRGRLSDKRRIAQAVSTYPATFVAFDILYNGKELMKLSLSERKKILTHIVEPSDHIVPTMSIQGEGIRLKQGTEQWGWEGIVAKRLDSKYAMDTRSTQWVKVKNWRQIDTVILGYRLNPQVGLIVGLNFPTVQNKRVATVELGFKPEERQAFLGIAKQLHTRMDKDVQWIEPRLCCRVQYLERTEQHHLRTVSFKGFLFDKQPNECKWVS
ncbi:DNA ligase [Alicyclobacillus fastidiosus]|uniref:ATP-dependent DNA ligase n=1 Tax=Alicyclobacillus fastidiosus TaxID=392011 RepID=UPI0023E97889|nr:DNA ligase [Alicyclobacillus fastidiosus]GMA66014.1 ATP-dependent DNA ligase [Alicyclobacillus fastidiosus]